METETTTEQVVEPVEPAVDEYKEIKEALAKERKARKEAEKQAKKLETDRESLERRNLEEKEEYKKLWETDKEKLTQLENAIREKDINAEMKSIADAITKDGNKRDDIMALYKQYAQHTENGVQFIVSGIEVSKEDLVNRIKTDRPYLVDGSQASGGGASGGSGGALKSFSELTERERVELYNKSPEQYAQRRDADKK